MASSTIPSSLIFDLSANSKTVGIGLRFSMFKIFMVLSVIMFIEAPKSMSVFGKERLLIDVVVIGIPVSTYYSRTGVVVIKLAKCPITWIVCGSFLFLALFFLHISLIVLEYMRISLMARRRGILILIFLNSSKTSVSGKTSIFSCFCNSGLSGKGADFGSRYSHCGLNVFSIVLFGFNRVFSTSSSIIMGDFGLIVLPERKLISCNSTRNSCNWTGNSCKTTGVITKVGKVFTSTL